MNRIEQPTDDFQSEQGPAEFTVTNEQSITLPRGRLVGEVSDDVSGLVVTTDDAKIIGTEFGVGVEPGNAVINSARNFESVGLTESPPRILCTT